MKILCQFRWNKSSKTLRVLPRTTTSSFRTCNFIGNETKRTSAVDRRVLACLMQRITHFLDHEPTAREVSRRRCRSTKCLVYDPESGYFALMFASICYVQCSAISSFLILTAKNQNVSENYFLTIFHRQKQNKELQVQKRCQNVFVAFLYCMRKQVVVHFSRILIHS